MPRQGPTILNCCDKTNDARTAHSPIYIAAPRKSSAAHACSPAGQPAGAAVCPIPALASRCLSDDIRSLLCCSFVRLSSM